MVNIATARCYQDLLGADVESGAYDHATLFDGEGFWARRRAKRRFQLLKKLETRLSAVLQPGERVFFVTTGTTVSFAEKFFVGWIAQYLNRRAIVFTTNRILLFHVNRGDKPIGPLSQIRYEEMAALKSSFSVCQIRFRDKRKINFVQIPRTERRFLHNFLAEIIKPVPLQAGESVYAPEHLCPGCFAVNHGHPGGCSACGAEFKSVGKATLLSLLFPGLGNFYLGHRFIAMVEMFGTALVWLFAIARVTSGEAVDPDTGEVIVYDSIPWLSIVLIIGITHLIDALTTRSFALKGHFLTGKHSPKWVGKP